MKILEEQEQQKKKVEEISKQLGIPVSQLLETYTYPAVIIEKYENNEIKLLNEG